MAKVQVTDFSPDVCEGCPHRQLTDENVDGVAGAAAKAEGKVLGAVTGEDQFKCGLCSCPLANLALLNMAPEDCPRLLQHDR